MIKTLNEEIAFSQHIYLAVIKCPPSFPHAIHAKEAKKVKLYQNLYGSIKG